MASIDELVAAIAVGNKTVEQAKIAVRNSSDRADELTEAFAHVGLEGKAAAIGAIKTGLDELHKALSGVTEALNQSQAKAEALRGTGRAGTSLGSGLVVQLSPGGPSVTKPSSAPGPQHRCLSLFSLVVG